MTLLFAGPGAAPRPAGFLSMRVPSDVLAAAGRRHESACRHRPAPRGCVHASAGGRDRAVKPYVPWLVRGRGPRDEPAGCATIDHVSSLRFYGLSTCSMRVDPFVM